MRKPRAVVVNAVHHIARYGAPETTKSLLTFARTHHPEDIGLQAELLKAIRNGSEERGASLDDDARGWAAELAGKLLASKQPADVKAGAELVGQVKLDKEEGKVTALAADRSAPRENREAALGALMALDAAKNAPVAGGVLAEADAPIELREAAAKLLGQANKPETQAQLLQALPAAPARLQTAIAAGLAGSREGGEKLLEAVAAGKASARLLQEKAVETPLLGSKIPDIKDRLAKLTKGLPPADQKIQQLLVARHKGFEAAKPDAAAGAKVFEKNCMVCHTLASKGAKVGPQLDGVGIRGLDRLLEDVLDPNRNVDQNFRMTILNLKDGKVVRGLLLREEGEVYVMADDKGKEVRRAEEGRGRPQHVDAVADAGRVLGPDPGGGFLQPDGVPAQADGEAGGTAEIGESGREMTRRLEWLSQRRKERKGLLFFAPLREFVCLHILGCEKRRVWQIIRESGGEAELRFPVILPGVALLQCFQRHYALSIVPVPAHPSTLDALGRGLAHGLRRPAPNLPAQFQELRILDHLPTIRHVVQNLFRRLTVARSTQPALPLLELFA